MGKKKKKNRDKKAVEEQIKYPIVICKFYRPDGGCAEMFERLCCFKKMDYLGNMLSTCGRYRPEADGDVL